MRVNSESDILRQPVDISYDLDASPLDGYTDVELPDSGTAMEDREIPELLAKKTPAKLGIVLSCLMHVSVFAAILYAVERGPVRALVNPGEQVTPVRIVEFQEPKKSVEPPPNRPSALSDRDHTAEREKMRKSLPVGTMGKVFGPENMMAALVPPRAPEKLEKSDESQDDARETPKEEETRKEKLEDRKASRSDDHKREMRRKPSVKPRRSPSRASDLRPTPEETQRALSGVPGSLFGDPKGDPDELVVDINTQEDKLVSYLLGLKRKIQGVWIYPELAGRNGIGGMLTVEFVIAKDGKLLGVRQLDSSGHKILDTYAVRAIKSAAPYYPFPQRIQAKRLRIRAQFVYATASFFRSIL